METEKEGDEETRPKSQAESSQECLVLWGCMASLVVEACGEGLVQLDLSQTWSWNRRRGWLSEHGHRDASPKA